MRNIKFLTKLLAVCLSAVVFMNVPSASYAETVKTVQPRYTSISSASVYLNISNGVAYISGTTIGKSDVKEAHVKCNLEKLMGSYWMQMKTWTSTVAGNYASVNEQFSVSSGLYRVMGTHRCDSETITLYTSNQTCE